MDLFSYEDEDDADEPSSESFSFEVENKIEKPADKTENIVEKIVFSDEKPVEFTFLGEKSFEKSEISTPEAAIPPTQKMEEKIIPEYRMEETAVEEIVETKIETSGDFIFKSKSTPDSEKVLERRNKLKEFNSRYQVTDSESDFENIPAFKRKNIVIAGQNHSEQKINTYLSENERGQMQVRENKFLNKDVD